MESLYTSTHVYIHALGSPSQKFLLEALEKLQTSYCAFCVLGAMCYVPSQGCDGEQIIQLVGQTEVLTWSPKARPT